MILDCLVAAINNDTEQLSFTTDVRFPKHLTDEVCNYVIVGDGYFNFRGRDGLIRELRRFLPNDHYLVDIVKQQSYKGTLERLSALRNHAAHESETSKARAMRAVDQERMPPAGARLKKRNRLHKIAQSLDRLADQIVSRAPY